MEKVKITLRNDFHGTTANVMARPTRFDGEYHLSDRQISGAEKKLCPVTPYRQDGKLHYCNCGYIRGPQFCDSMGGRFILDNLGGGDGYAVYPDKDS